MSFITEGRVGLRPEITGFIVTEDRSLEARLKRAYHLARNQGATRSQPAGVIPASTQTTEQSASMHRPSPAVLRLAGTRQRLEQALAALRPDGERLRGHAAVLARMLPDRDRLRDVASLITIGFLALCRLVWRLPRLAKVVLFGFCLIGGALLWPRPAEDAGHEMRLAMAVVDPAPATPAPIAAPPMAATPAARWRTIAAPIPSYNLEAPELNRASATLKARAASDGARQEIHQWSGKSRRDALGGMVVIEHYTAAPPAETLYVDLVRRAALVGAAVERTGEVVGLESKFGEIDTIEARIVAAGETEAQSCLAFRRVETAPMMQIHGWFCGSASVPVDRATIGCIVDRIDLLRAGSDVALKRYFARIERARKPCGAPRQAVAKPGWIDAGGAMPPLKSSLPGSAARG